MKQMRPDFRPDDSGASLVEAASSSAQADADSRPGTRWWPLRAMVHPALVPSSRSAPMVRSPNDRSFLMARQWPPSSGARSNLPPTSRSGLSVRNSTETEKMVSVTLTRSGAPIGAVEQSGRASQTSPPISCSTALASCRHHVATVAVRMRAKRLEAATRGVRSSARGG